MAEFVDVEMFHAMDEPPVLSFKDDHGNYVTVGHRIRSVEATDGWVETWRLQRDDIRNL